MTYKAVPVLSLLLGACIQLGPTSAPPECEVNADCNTAAGEVCGEGVCWGDPPAGQYAAVISPPSYRGDLIATELTVVTIGPDGWMEPLSSAWPDSLHGRIEAACEGCRSGGAIAAKITVRRPSSIPGAPEFLATTTSDPTAADGVESFTLQVPASSGDSQPFQVTIEPSDTVEIVPGGPTAAEVVPPLRLTVTPGDLAAGLHLTLDAAQVRTVHGRIVDGQGQGVGGLRTYAKGRVDPMRPLERVSTIDVSDEQGYFDLLLGGDALDVIDVLAEPPPGVIAPTLIAHDRYAASPDTLTLRMPAWNGSTHVTVPVVYTDTNGQDAAVTSARVALFTEIPDAEDPLVSAVYEVDGQTDDLGHFDADVLLGSDAEPRTYYVRVTPPPEAITASKLDLRDVGSHGGVLDTIRLDQRSIITGTLTDAYGYPVDGVTLEGSPSLWFLWTLDADTQQLVEDRGAPQAATNPDGSFILWLDPAVNGVAASYDLEVEPPDFASVPRAMIHDVDASVGHDLGYLALPEAAYVRGVVTDPYGDALIDAQVRLYAISADPGACIAQNAPADCQPPATTVATGRTDENGIVRLTLAR